MTNRSGIRMIVWVVASILAGRELLAAHHHYVAWRGATGDPSARDAYLTFLEIELGLALIVLAIAAITHAMLRRTRAEVPLSRPGV